VCAGSTDRPFPVARLLPHASSGRPMGEIRRQADARPGPREYGQVVPTRHLLPGWVRSPDLVALVDVVLAVLVAGFGVATV
jgi:hypothetical protein